jgi:hypothetical protein
MNVMERVVQLLVQPCNQLQHRHQHRVLGTGVVAQDAGMVAYRFSLSVRRQARGC